MGPHVPPDWSLDVADVMETCQVHHAPGNVDLKADAQDVDPQQRADSQEAENQPPLEAHGRHGETNPGWQAACVPLALCSPRGNMEAAAGQEERAGEGAVLHWTMLWDSQGAQEEGVVVVVEEDC